jgi:hypothetical protein
MRWQRSAAATLVAVPLTLAALAGCGTAAGGTQVASAGRASAGATASPSTSPAADPDDRRLQFTRCLREHGVNVPDPDPGGRPGQGGGMEALHGVDRQKLDDALNACRQYSGGAIAHEGLSEQDKQQLLDYTRCLRGQGVDIGDPDPTTGLPPVQDLARLRADPNLDQARKACTRQQPDFLGGGGR